MRNLKKFLALVLAMMMAFSLMVTVNAATTTSFKDDADITPVFSDAVYVLDQLEILQGYGTSGLFGPKDPIQRDQFATILYRLLHKDLDGEQVGIYAGADYFPDVTNQWFAGYVNYVANSQVLMGRTSGLYDPSANITGYEVIVTLLRALGYNQNNEYTGNGWQLTSARKAAELGITQNINEGRLGQPATREEVAEMVYQAMQLFRPTYIFGNYVTDGALGKDPLVALSSSLGENKWGTPTITWTATWGLIANRLTDRGRFVQQVDCDYENEDHVRVDECDIAKALGIETYAAIESVWVDGQVYYPATSDADATALMNGTCVDGIGHLTVTPWTLNALDTTSYVGGQGASLKVYNVSSTAVPSYRIVIVNTYLAQVASVTAAYTDKGQHVVPATATFNVFTADNNQVNNAGQGTVYTADSRTVVTDEYAKDDYALVNIYRGSNPTYTSSRLALADITPVSPVAAGAVTKTSNRDDKDLTPGYTTVGSKEYKNSAQFHHYNGENTKQAAVNAAISRGVIEDAYGNIIGLVPVATNYLLVESIQWISVGARDGDVYADLRLLDGSDLHDKTVTEIYGKKDIKEAASGTASFTTPSVSNNWRNNEDAYYYQLIAYTEKDDGTYALVNKPGAAVDFHTAGSEISTYPNMNYIGTDKTKTVSNNTVFFIYDKENREYDRVVGKANIPSLTDAKGYAYDLNNDNFLDVVVIYDYTVAGSNAFVGYVGVDARIETNGKWVIPAGQTNAGTYQGYRVWDIYNGQWRTVWVECVETSGRPSSQTDEKNIFGADNATPLTQTGLYYFTVNGSDIADYTGTGNTKTHFMTADDGVYHDFSTSNANGEPNYKWYAKRAASTASHVGITFRIANSANTSARDFNLTEDTTIYRATTATVNGKDQTTYKEINIDEIGANETLFVGYTTDANGYDWAKYIVVYGDNRDTPDPECTCDGCDGNCSDASSGCSAGSCAGCTHCDPDSDPEDILYVGSTSEDDLGVTYKVDKETGKITVNVNASLIAQIDPDGSGVLAKATNRYWNSATNKYYVPILLIGLDKDNATNYTCKLDGIKVQGASTSDLDAGAALEDGTPTAYEWFWFAKEESSKTVARDPGTYNYTFTWTNQDGTDGSAAVDLVIS